MPSASFSTPAAPVEELGFLAMAEKQMVVTKVMIKWLVKIACRGPQTFIYFGFDVNIFDPYMKVSFETVQCMFSRNHLVGFWLRLLSKDLY